MYICYNLKEFVDYYVTFISGVNIIKISMIDIEIIYCFDCDDYDHNAEDAGFLIKAEEYPVFCSGK